MRHGASSQGVLIVAGNEMAECVSPCIFVPRKSTISSLSDDQMFYDTDNIAQVILYCEFVNSVNRLKVRF